MTAGYRLRRALHAELAEAGEAAGIKLVFTRPERWLLDRACALEDRREQLDRSSPDLGRFSGLSWGFVMVY